MNNVMAKIVMLAALASMAIAADGPSIQKGEELFKSTELGTNGKSCYSCHSGGKGMERAAGYEQRRLTKIINNCIANPLEGGELDPASNEMKSLIMYIETFKKTVRSSRMRA